MTFGFFIAKVYITYKGCATTKNYYDELEARSEHDRPRPTVVDENDGYESHHHERRGNRRDFCTHP